MGGSGSTGSSLLKNILNRHEAVFAGEETSLFAKKEVYENWTKAKAKLMKRGVSGLRNFGYHIYNGTDLLEPAYNWSESELTKVLADSASLDAFCDRFFGKVMDTTDAHIWIEKTPANAATFRFFQEQMDQGKVIHMVRNPYDTITSLWKRGFDLYYAVGIYLLNTASALACRRNDGRYLEVAYEGLVADPASTVASACRFLDIRYHERMLTSKGEKITDSQLSGWQYDETADIGKRSVGRFAGLSDADQNQVLEAVSMIAVNLRGLDYFGLQISTVEQICDVLRYEYYPVGSRKTRSYLIQAKRKDRWMRLRRGYSTGVYYPLEIQ